MAEEGAIAKLDTEKYLIEEMKAARLRIDEEIKTMNQFEILSIAAIWAIYGAFLTFKILDHGALVVMTTVPFAICVYGVFRYRAHADVVKIHERYIKHSIEAAFFPGDAGGLVRYYDKKKRSLLRTARLTFWVALSALTFAILVVAVVCPERLTQVYPKTPSVVGGVVG
ncbi:MAG: hypothetical protein WC670_19085 [Pseudolabrys sp.]